MEETGFDKLGFYQLAIVYLCLGTGSLIAKPIMTLVGGPQRCMMIGSFLDALWILASVSAATGTFSDGFIFTVTSVTSVLAGFGEALQWVAQGKYVADCACLQNKGFFFGYFWAFYMASQVFGSLLAAVVLQHSDLITFYLLMAVVAGASVVVFYFLKDPHPFEVKPQILTSINAESTASTREQAPIYEGQLSDNLASSSRPRTTFAAQWEITKQDSKVLLELMISKRMRWVLPEIVWAGISLAIYTGLLVPMISNTLEGRDNTEKLMKSMYAMVCLGVGEIVGSLAIGQVIDRYG